MIVLVTGTNGFIGKALLNNIMHTPGAFTKVIRLDDTTDHEFWQDDVKHFLSYYRPDVIFHIGACSDTQNFDVQEMMVKNVESTFILANYAKTNSIPIIYSSSASCYGNGDGPISLYAWSKFIGEQYVINAGGIALRYFNVFGYDESHKNKMASFIYQAYQKHKNNSIVEIFPSQYEDSRPRRDFVYIEDVISANLYAYANYSRLRESYYDVGSGTATSYEDVMKYMQIPFEYAPYSAIPINYQYYTKADPNRFMLGWKPNWRVRDGILDYMNILQSL